jgi:hypothetical protein
MPPEEALLKCYGPLYRSHDNEHCNNQHQPMTKSGTHWLVTSRGHRVLSTSINNMGVLTMEHLLVQALPPSVHLI